MIETNLINEMNKEIWDELSSQEKALVKNYVRILTSETKKPTRKQFIAVNDIHDKYPDFHIGCIP
jgi:preprotein translocase subunit Sss1